MSIRACVFALTSFALALAFSAPVRADVRWIDVGQMLPRPAGYTAWGTDVAIDGGYIIVMAGTEGYYDARFLAINDQLQLYVNATLVATAHDRAIASGQYGLATYRAAANWDSFAVLQP